MVSPSSRTIACTPDAATETVLVNVAATPPAAVAHEVDLLRKRAQAIGGLLAPGSGGSVAHLTLFMARFAVDVVADVEAEVAALAAEHAPAFAAHDGYFLTPGFYYEASYRRDAGLLRIHGALLDRLSALRFRPGAPRAEAYFGEYSPQQRSNAERYGYDLAADLFRPHVTITRFPERPGDPLPVSGEDLSFPVRSLASFRADEWGSAKELLTEHPLAG